MLVRGDFSDACPGRFFGRSPSLGDIYRTTVRGFFVWLWVVVFFIRYRRLACIAFFVFLNEEYLIALVDFIAPCGGTKERGRRTLRSPPSPPSGLPPFQPWGIRCGGLIGLPRVYANLGSWYPVQVANRHFDVRIGCFVFGLVSFAFQLVLPGLYRTFFIIGWKKDAVCLALTHVF